MKLNRRHILRGSAGFAGAFVAVDGAPAAQLTSALGRDATQYGVRPNGQDDQTRVLQRAIDEAGRVQAPLALPPGTYRTAPYALSAARNSSAYVARHSCSSPAAGRCCWPRVPTTLVSSA